MRSSPVIVYLSMARIPGRSAHTIQICRTCDALTSLGARVYLIVPSLSLNLPRRSDLEAILSYYGLRCGFHLIRLRMSKIFIKLSEMGGLPSIFVNFLLIVQFLLLTLALKIAFWGRRFFLYLRGRFIFSSIAMLAPWLLRDVVFEVHNVRRLMLHGWAGKVKFSAMRRCRVIITIASYLKRILQKLLGVGVNIEVVHDAANASLFEKIGLNVDELRRRLRLGDFKVVMYVGSLYSWKKPEFIVDAFKLLRRNDVVLVFIGGLDEDISRVKSYCEAIGVDRVIFTGFIKPRNVPIYLKLADILVHYTPRGRGFSPLKIFEYMCARKPIVAPNSPGVNEVLRDGVNALLYNPESPEDMAYKIKLILDDSELGFKLAEQAYLDAINKYTFKARAERILKVLNVYGG